MREPKLIFPSWGRYGVRVEVKPPNENFKNPKLMISEVKKDEQALTGWKFYMRAFNESQQTRGFYNAHCSIPVDSLPLVIAELVDIWNELKPEGAEEVSDEAADITMKAKHGEEAGELLRESRDMAELADPNLASQTKRPPRVKATGPPSAGRKTAPPTDSGDPYEMIRKKKGGPSAPDAPEDESGNPDDYIPF